MHHYPFPTCICEVLQLNLIRFLQHILPNSVKSVRTRIGCFSEKIWTIDKIGGEERLEFYFTF